jgi:uncharacterized membrane protein YhhN
MTTLTILIVIASTSALVWAVRAESPRARWLKMASSTGFLAVALSAGAASSSYGRIVLVALALSWLGDLLLTFESRRAFLGGLVVFLLGHVAYSVGFVTLRADPISLVVAALAVAIIGGLVWRWLSPHMGDMKNPVIAYIVVISVMVISAFGTVDGATNWLIPIGATLFFVSDLFVARNRFVAPGALNRIWGLPLYYAAQVLLGLSVAT